MSNTDLSIIVPVHNESGRLPNCLATIGTFMDNQPFTYEVIIVENGSVDQTVEIARAAEKSAKNIRLIVLNERGKGAAVGSGMLLARGAWCLMADVDWSMPIEFISEFWSRRYDAEVLIATREGPGAVRVGESQYRHVTGRLFNWLVQALLLPGIDDTQCGFKMFSWRAAKNIFAQCRLRGLSFDVEALYLGRRMGYRIDQVPITWICDPSSRVKMASDSIQMAQDIIKIRQFEASGKYKIALT